MARYRYIVDECDLNDSISSYWLRRTAKDAAKLKPGVGEMVYRVHIPEDMVMVWKSKANLYVTEDARTISELGYDILMNTWDGRQIVVQPGSNVEWLVEREKQRWRIANLAGERANDVGDYSGPSVGEWFGGR